jgi:hypothetical protein
MMNLRDGIYRLMTNVFGPAKTADLFVNHRGHVRTFDTAMTGRWLQAHVPAVREVPANRFLGEIYAALYETKTPDELQAMLPAADIPSIRSYIPYVRGRTQTFVFNFLKNNYGIKDPILIRLSIASVGAVHYSRQYVLPANAVRLFDDPFVDTEDKAIPENALMVVEAFHLRIDTSERQFRFIGIYRNDDAGTVCGVHSMPIPSKLHQKPEAPGSRSVGHAGPVQIYSCLSDPAVTVSTSPANPAAALHPLKLAKATGIGYVILLDATGNPCAIWHDDLSAHAVARLDGAQVGKNKIRQAFFVPNFQSCAPVLLFSEAQLGFCPATVMLTASDETGTVLATRDISLSQAFETVDLARVFADNGLTGGLNFTIDFNEDAASFNRSPTAYVHIYYRSKTGFSDQVHSHMSFGHSNDPDPKPQPYRCRKFAPLLKDQTLESYFSIVNLGGTGPNKDVDLRLRVFTDKGNEYVFDVDVPADRITNIRASDVLARLSPDSIDVVGVIQIEHETTNFNASWYLQDVRTHHLGVDHFTGG